MRSPPAAPAAPRPGTAGVTGLASVVTDSFAVVLGRLGVVVLGLVFVVLATHLLGPSDYGVFALILLSATVLMTASSAWLTTAALRYGRQELEERGTMAPVTWSRVVIGAPVFVAGIAGLAVVDLAGGLPAELSAGGLVLVAALGLGLAVQEHQ